MKVIVKAGRIGIAALFVAVAPVAAQQQQGQNQAQRPAQSQPVAPAQPSAAPVTGATKVGYVNTREILKQTPGYAHAESTYNKELANVEAEVQKLRGGLDSAAGDFERQSTMLSATQRTAKRKALEDQEQQAQQRLQQLRENIAKREQELLEPIQSRINSVIEGVRAAGGYAIIFDVSVPNSAIVTADRSLDLTQRVIQQLKSGN